MNASTTAESALSKQGIGLGRFRKTMLVLAIAGALASLVVFAGLWNASDVILNPTFKSVTNFDECALETEEFFGEQCGNLAQTEQFEFSSVHFESANGELPGWLVAAADNNRPRATDAIVLVHAGGSDRRQMTKFIGFYLDNGLDVLTFDLSCHGAAPCNRAGTTYGARESLDVAAAYDYLSKSYERVYAMGTSVGATAVLLASPQMPGLAGSIIENPYASFERLLKDSPEAESMPPVVTDALIALAEWRGGFDDTASAEIAIEHVSEVPLLFIHSLEDATIDAEQTRELAEAYSGPHTVWFAEKGEHAGIWDADPGAYQEVVESFLDSTRGL